MRDKRRPPQELNENLAPFTEALRALAPSREALLAEGKAQTRRQANRRKAAGGALAVLLGVGVWTFDPPLGYHEVKVAVGAHESLRLDDGSQVELNSGSTLRIQYRLRSRQVRLVQGEALFRVVHADSPFIVHSQDTRIRDIGTVFDVRSDAYGVRVGVIEGAVAVSQGNAAPRELHAGQQVLARQGTLGETRPAKADDLQAWRDGRLHFDGTPLAEVLATLQAYRTAPIRLEGEVGPEHRLSGDFSTASVEVLIDSLPRLLPVYLGRGGDGSVTVGLMR